MPTSARQGDILRPPCHGALTVALNVRRGRRLLKSLTPRPAPQRPRAVEWGTSAEIDGALGGTLLSRGLMPEARTGEHLTRPSRGIPMSRLRLPFGETIFFVPTCQHVILRVFGRS